MPRIRRRQPAVEQMELPAEMSRKMDALAHSRAWPIFTDSTAYERPLMRAIRDVYLQGLADGYECAERRMTD